MLEILPKFNLLFDDYEYKSYTQFVPFKNNTILGHKNRND